MEALFGLFGVLVGGAASFVGTYYAHKWSMEKEREQWDRQQKAENNKLAREELKLARTHLLEIYSNAIYYLTIYVTEDFRPIDEDSDDAPPMSDEERKQHFLDVRKNRQSYYLEAQRYVLLLLPNLTNTNDSDLKEFEKLLNSFIEDMGYDAIELRNLIVKLARSDQRLKEGISSLSLGGLTNLLPEKPKEKEIQ
jgi:hypothetical protein